MGKKEKTDVALYDREMLEHTEVQPICTEDGHTITVNKYGDFYAKVGEVECNGPVLQKVKERVHAAHLSLVRKTKKKAMAVAAFVFSEGGYKETKFVGPGFFRGIHAGNGKVQWAEPDGSKGAGENVTLFDPGDLNVPLVTHLYERQVELQTELDEVKDRLQPIILKQRERMSKGLEVGWGGTVRVHNDSARAQEVADKIVANVLTPKTKKGRQ